ncbi:MAG: nucleotidyl transferase AbiEii/AbiGii toxin family protein [Gemmatimonadota bacterium]|jgi:predicted nucleotidyltransferase component of viral defense system
MIRDAEIRRLAGAAGVEPRIVELDYALGWALGGIARNDYLSGRLVFKGGTCLRKCYFPDYRFSEDLDFTAMEWFGWEDMGEAVTQAFSTAAELSGIDFAAQEPRMRIIEEEYGRETLRLTHYWRGPHTTAGSPPGIRLDITRDEVLAFEPASRKVFHPFSDAEFLAPLRIRCYALEEVMAEKLRAILGQRIFAVSRDLYDIFSLLDQVDEKRVLGGFPKKLDVRGLGPEGLGAGRLTGRREEFRADWERNLVHLLPPGGERGFDGVWDPVSDLVARVMASLQ